MRRRKRERSESDFVPLLITSVIMTAVLSFCLLYFMEVDVDDANTMPAKKARRLISAVVLQSSPVDPAEQVERLKVIDETWANWKTAKMRVSIYAAVKNEATSFRNLKKMNLGEGPSAASNMGRLRMALLRIHEQDWHFLLLVNDHSFVIPHNLEAFLMSLPRRSSEKLVYSGHKLALNQNQQHVFASGGAGLLMSRPCVTLLLTVWTLITPDWCGDLCPGWIIEKDGDRRIHLSRTISLDIGEDTITLEQEDREPMKVSRSDLRSSCTARKGNTWEEENFGVVVSHCLLDLFHAEFPPALDLSSESELFNVYDPVRVLRHDVDDWWIKAKTRAGQRVDTARSLTSSAISWHYVNSAEARLLYQYLGREPSTQTDPMKLIEEWKPASWAYGKGPKTREDATTLLEYLSSTRQRISGQQ